MWPNSLEQLTISFALVNQGSWGNGVLSTMLAPHRTTLRSLVFGPLLGEDDIFEFSSFSELEELSVSIQNLHKDPQIAISRILGPRLQTVTLSLNVVDTAPPDIDWRRFPEWPVGWVRRFAEYSSTIRSPLTKLIIDFSPSLWEFEYNATRKDMRYPWDLLNDLRDAIAGRGITLSYKKPTLTRFEFERKLKHDYGYD
jgi:hypothetical protein